MYRRALAIDERSYGPDQPDVATGLNNLAGLLLATNRLKEAEPLYRRALGDRRAVVRPRSPRSRHRPQQSGGVALGHEPATASRAALRAAVQILARFHRLTGHEHPGIPTVLDNYRGLLLEVKRSKDEIAARIAAARESTGELAPIVPVVEERLGPARPVAEVLAALDEQYRKEGKPAVYFLDTKVPIAPHLEELLRPRAGDLLIRGVAS